MEIGRKQTNKVKYTSLAENDFCKIIEMRNSSLTKAILFNFICLASLGITIMLFAQVGEPYHRGFFCDDESISKPFKNGTVPSSIAALVGILLPVVCILAIEVPRFREAGKRDTQPFYKTRWCHWLATVITFFLVGAAATVVLTDVGKYTVGRLRPHFFAVCKLNFSSLNCTLGLEKHFVTNYECTGDKDLVREARLSFPSGHSSFAAYCMMFLVFYIDIRMSFCKGLELFKPLVEFVLLLMAILCGLSRISDYEHHWSDVLAGLILGTLIAMVFIYRVLRLHRVKLTHTEDQSGGIANISVQEHSDSEQGEA